VILGSCKGAKQQFLSGNQVFSLVCVLNSNESKSERVSYNSDSSKLVSRWFQSNVMIRSLESPASFSVEGTAKARLWEIEARLGNQPAIVEKLERAQRCLQEDTAGKSSSPAGEDLPPYLLLSHARLRPFQNEVKGNSESS